MRVPSSGRDSVLPVGNGASELLVLGFLLLVTSGLLQVYRSIALTIYL